jgi:GTP cyclohydrolase I
MNKEHIAVKELLEMIGEDTNREGLLETPKRYVNFLKQFTEKKEFKFTTFESDSDEMVIVRDIPFYSLCEHHLAPFFGTAHIAYIPNEKMAGISKLPRTLDMFANKPQNQERITKQVAEYLMQQLEPKGVAVVLKARHMCMEMRGVKKSGAETVTSSMLGAFKDDSVCRSEFLNLIKI